MALKCLHCGGPVEQSRIIDINDPVQDVIQRFPYCNKPECQKACKENQELRQYVREILKWQSQYSATDVENIREAAQRALRYRSPGKGRG